MRGEWLRSAFFFTTVLVNHDVKTCAVHRTGNLDYMSRSRPNYSGMTVNERLGVAGLFPEWNAAIAAGDRQRAIDVLGRVDIDETRASSTVDTTLADPSKYGFPNPSSRAQ